MRAKLDGSAQVMEATPDLVIGSGKIGYTFLYDRGGRFTESRTSYYPPARRWTWTPGQREARPDDHAWGRPLSTERALKCLLCHSTAVAREGETILAHRSLFNVGCERCHGPGREHVRAARAGQGSRAVYTYGKASGGTIMALCGDCHGSPVEGLTIDRKQAETAKILPRFASVALPLSRCFERSNGRLTCVTCHDPHRPLSTDAAGYDRTCKGCHEPARAGTTVCPVDQKSGCSGCHMPAQSVPFPIDRKFRTHWIRAWPKHGPRRSRP